jgi:hypothetical protein
LGSYTVSDLGLGKAAGFASFLKWIRKRTFAVSMRRQVTWWLR